MIFTEVRYGADRYICSCSRWYSQKEGDAPTVGLLVCKNKDNVLTQYAVNSSNAPVGISEYELSDLMPENFRGTLPSIEEIERELK